MISEKTKKRLIPLYVFVGIPIISALVLALVLLLEPFSVQPQKRPPTPQEKNNEREAILNERGKLAQLDRICRDDDCGAIGKQQHFDRVWIEDYPEEGAADDR